MNKLDWVKDIVRNEIEREQKGVVELSNDLLKNDEKFLERESIIYLKHLQQSLKEACSLFNDLKNSPDGQIKIYGISNTVTDFMLFRNGFRLIFSLKIPGVISVKSGYLTNFYMPQSQPVADAGNNIDHEICAHWGPLEELQWSFNNSEIKQESLVKYYLKFFARNSATDPNLVFSSQKQMTLKEII